jgi:hypothetical protein
MGLADTLILPKPGSPAHPGKPLGIYKATMPGPATLRIPSRALLAGPQTGPHPPAQRQGRAVVRGDELHDRKVQNRTFCGTAQGQGRGR